MHPFFERGFVLASDVEHNLIPTFKPVIHDLVLRYWHLDEVIQLDAIFIWAVTTWRLKLCISHFFELKDSLVYAFFIMKTKN